MLQYLILVPGNLPDIQTPQAFIMAVEVVPLTKADIPGAIEVIQQAFADDPYFKWVFDSSKVRYVLRNKYPKKETSYPSSLTRQANIHLSRDAVNLTGSYVSRGIIPHIVQQAKKL